MTEIWGVLAAILSSGIGGTAVAATRSVAGRVDPLTLGAFRFGVGFVFLLPVALLQPGRWPAGRDLPRIAGLGILFFGVFPVLFNASLVFTTAARGALALSTLPLLTLLAGAVLKVEPMTARKTGGVLIAMVGVALALLSGLDAAPAGAWRGDLLMIGAAFCMALYTVWSRPFIGRWGAIRFTTMAMGIGALGLAVIAALRGGFAAAAGFGAAQWLAVAYLGIVGSAFVFILWSFALTRTTPTRVAISVAVNPITASVAGALLLGEPLRWNIVAGLVAVMAGIGLATAAPREGRGRRSRPDPSG
ncbi:DMT family transporter [Labrys monachus]|uniref:Drug/metabolite transporter (DMT)-like permease n=1 Tax=Labrys monachus TaxID=217067 RepID=A0ABU0FEX7_9HYPH|nr:DMT family transporter [Labrys monachus]MDQ0393169.1 drug/metabolite transporter (DMT)-like permease [Labrys monachus]